MEKCSLAMGGKQTALRLHPGQNGCHQAVNSGEREGGAVTVGGNADRCSHCEVSLVIPQQTTHRTITSPRSTTPGCTH